MLVVPCTASAPEPCTSVPLGCSSGGLCIKCSCTKQRAPTVKWTVTRTANTQSKHVRHNASQMTLRSAMSLLEKIRGIALLLVKMAWELIVVRVVKNLNRTWRCIHARLRSTVTGLKNKIVRTIARTRVKSSHLPRSRSNRDRSRRCTDNFNFAVPSTRTGSCTLLASTTSASPTTLHIPQRLMVHPCFFHSTVDVHTCDNAGLHGVLCLHDSSPPKSSLLPCAWLASIELQPFVSASHKLLLPGTFSILNSPSFFLDWTHTYRTLKRLHCPPKPFL